MYKMFSSMRIWLARLFEAEVTAEVRSDPLGRMSPRELADLPVYHPRYDNCIGA